MPRLVSQPAVSKCNKVPPRKDRQIDWPRAAEDGGKAFALVMAVKRAILTRADKQQSRALKQTERNSDADEA
jgi:hypothetical protein